mgnify:CR=1 FL=1
MQVSIASFGYYRVSGLAQLITFGGGKDDNFSFLHFWNRNTTFGVLPGVPGTRAYQFHMANALSNCGSPVRSSCTCPNSSLAALCLITKTAKCSLSCMLQHNIVTKEKQNGESIKHPVDCQAPSAQCVDSTNAREPTVSGGYFTITLLDAR